MLPESTNGAGGGGLAVPMDWLCAEYVADEVLRAGGLVAPGSLEFRSGVRTLALTVLLDGPGPAGPGVDGWLRRTAHDHPWDAWVTARLAEPGPAVPEPDLALARDTWRRLRATELRAADLAGLAGLGPAGGALDEERQVWLPAWQLGVALSHLALHLC
ncbi:hypothetical protein ACF065_21180 [Streptomyces sp. NPDC015232]|uniref:hypothetical protein n=1 Tax=unclassified Streptomyces TaxID=2593676 RepID=UPI0037015928